MTSEELLGIDPPPDHQCPNIDSYVKKAEAIAKAISHACKATEFEDALEYCKEADWDADDIPNHFEDLRTQLDGVRCWGQAWKNIAKELLEHHEPERLEKP